MTWREVVVVATLIFTSLLTLWAVASIIGGPS